jgi:hypothetical protein
MQLASPFYKISEHDAKWNYGKRFNNAMRETGQNNNFSNKLVQLKRIDS